MNLIWLGILWGLLCSGETANDNQTVMAKDHVQILEAFEASGQHFDKESLVTKDGHSLTIVFFQHATLALVWDETVVYVDPLTEYADYSRLPEADLVLVTHAHYDHFDQKAVRELAGPETVLVCSHEVGDMLSGTTPLSPGDGLEINPSLAVTAVAAYNTSLNHLQFHPKTRGDNGYIVQFDQTRIYIAGDTEVIPEMKTLGLVDIAFLPVNQPYTMTLEQAAEAARLINPGILFPYHTTDTDISKLPAMLADTPISVRIHPMP